MKKAIHQVAAEILAAENKPMTADEIFEIIAAKGLYKFNAKAPKSVLRSQLRRHSSNHSTQGQSSEPSFKILEDGRFTLI